MVNLDQKGQGQLVTWPLAARPASAGGRARHISPTSPGRFAPGPSCGRDVRRRAEAPRWEPRGQETNRTSSYATPQADGFGGCSGPSDRDGHDCYWDQHVEDALVSRPHRKAPSRDRGTQGGI
jgi:hypothetical protein